MNIKSLKGAINWAKVAFRSKKIAKRDYQIQIGCLLEEVSELLEVINKNVDDKPRHQDLKLGLQQNIDQIKNLSNYLKTTEIISFKKIKDTEDRVALLDALGDIIVTCATTSVIQKLKLEKGLTEINTSNFSKFKDGKPIIDENGKFAKNQETYQEPKLESFI